MLRALYDNPPPQAAPVAGGGGGGGGGAPDDGTQEAIWRRVHAFLEDAGGLMALRVELLQARAAEPWMALPPAPGSWQVCMCAWARGKA